MSRTFHARKLRTKKLNGRGSMAIMRGFHCRCWYCIGSKAYERKNNPPMPDPCELEGLQDELENPNFYAWLRSEPWQFYTEEESEAEEWLWVHPSQELAATIQEHTTYRWNGRPLPFARQHRNNWRRRLTKRFLASRYWRSERHTVLFRNFILDLTRKPLTRR